MAQRASPDEQLNREARHIAKDRARIEELEDMLARFHEQVGADPAIWRDHPRAGSAYNAACELRSVEHELCLIALMQLRRNEMQHRFSPETPTPPPLDPVLVHRARALEAIERHHLEIERLRAFGGAPELVRRADRERRARLRWLLDLFATVLPAAANETELTLESLRARDPHSPGHPMLYRRERQTADALARFLEPLLPE